MIRWDIGLYLSRQLCLMLTGSLLSIWKVFCGFFWGKKNLLTDFSVFAPTESTKFTGVKSRIKEWIFALGSTKCSCSSRGMSCTLESANFPFTGKSSFAISCFALASTSFVWERRWIKLKGSQSFFNVHPFAPLTRVLKKPLKGAQLLVTTETGLTCTHTSISCVYQGLFSMPSLFTVTHKQLKAVISGLNYPFPSNTCSSLLTFLLHFFVLSLADFIKTYIFK